MRGGSRRLRVDVRSSPQTAVDPDPLDHGEGDALVPAGGQVNWVRGALTDLGPSTESGVR
jgi:hypothetical protein